MKMLMLLMFGCVCMAIASVDRPIETNLDELARGQPVTCVKAETVSAPMPMVIETTRKIRDVDVSCSSNYIHNKNIEKLNAGKTKTSPSYSDRVGWRSKNRS